MGYLEQSAAVVQSLDRNEVGALPLGECVGNGSAWGTYTLGQLSVAGEAMYIGLKVGNPYAVERRARHDTALISMLVDYVPSLAPLVPRFLGVMAIEGEEDRTIITEDASMGNQFPVGPEEVRLPEAVETELFRGFAWAGPPEEVFDFRSLRRTIAFEVNGQYRLLDFLPSIFLPPYRKWPEYRTALEASHDHLTDLTVTIDPDSVLARSVIELLQSP